MIRSVRLVILAAAACVCMALAPFAYADPCVQSCTHAGLTRTSIESAPATLPGLRASEAPEAGRIHDPRADARQHRRPMAGELPRPDSPPPLRI